MTNSIQHITKKKLGRAIISGITVYFLVAYILSGEAPGWDWFSVDGFLELFFFVLFVSVMFSGQGFISVYFQRFRKQLKLPLGIKLIEFVVNLVFILGLLFLLFYLPLKLLYPNNIAGADILRLVHGMFLLVGLTHYYLLERERSEQALSKLQLETEKLARENFEARLLMLKKELNPDFLYHSLRKLKQFVNRDKPTAHLYLRKLSEIYRLFLHQVDQPLVSLSEEQHLLRSFLSLVKMEYGGRVQLSDSLSAEEKDRFLPSGLCRVVIENWVSSLAENENQQLCISLKRQEEALVLQAEFKDGLKPDQQESIRYLQKNYELQTEGACCPEFQEDEKNVRVILPLISTIGSAVTTN